LLQRLIIDAAGAEARDDWPTAAICWLKAIALAPKDHRLANNAAHALWLADQPARALDLVRQAVRLAPAEPLPWRNLANILRDLNRFEEAEMAYGRTMALEGHRDPLSAWNRSQTLIGLERYEQAYALAERRLELGDFEGWRIDLGRCDAIDIDYKGNSVVASGQYCSASCPCVDTVIGGRNFVLDQNSVAIDQRIAVQRSQGY
jgi:tetratricopeptide (TPR) repeat protein